MKKTKTVDSQAQFNVGKAYYWGLGIQKDKSEAMGWIRKSLEQNNKDVIEWIQKKAGQNDPRTQWLMGLTYDKGWCGKVDYTKALKWYRKAADRNNSDAQLSLGSMYETGRGVEKKLKTALAW